MERGLDPGDFVLVAFGGAGPLHAAEVARELGMRVLVPESPGVLCAMGVLTKDVQVDLSQTHLLRDAPGAGDAAAAVFESLAARARATLARTGQNADAIIVEHVVDARYRGQNFELQIPLSGTPDAHGIVAAVRRGFDAEHRRLYGYDQPEKPIELVTFRLRARVPIEPLAARGRDGARRAAVPMPGGTRRTFFAETGFCSCPVFARDELRPGDRLAGPLIVEQMDTTTVVPPGFAMTVDGQGNLVLEATP